MITGKTGRKNFWAWNCFVVQLVKSSIDVMFEDTSKFFEVVSRERHWHVSGKIIDHHFEADCDHY